MEIITVTNQKGGVGKTTTAQHLAIGLKNKGYRVLLVDSDQQTNLSYALNWNYNASLYEAITKKIDTKDAIFHSSQCDIIGGSLKLANADKEFCDTGKEFLFKEALEQIKDDYDYIIIDTPPALGTITVNALTCSDSVIIPAQTDVFSLTGLGQLNNLINTVKKYTNPNLKIKGILLTKYNDRTILNKNLKQTMKNASEQIGSKVYNTTIREATSIREAQTKKTNIFNYDMKSKVAKDYKDFVNEFLKDN